MITIESCILNTNQPQRGHLEAELRELRRKAWHWEEAERIARMPAEAIEVYELGPRVVESPQQRQRYRDLILLVLGGDAEWEQKAASK